MLEVRGPTGADGHVEQPCMADTQTHRQTQKLICECLSVMVPAISAPAGNERVASVGVVGWVTAY